MYYDDANPKFLKAAGTAALLTKAREVKTEDDRKAEEERRGTNTPQKSTLAPPYPFGCESRHCR